MPFVFCAVMQAQALHGTVYDMSSAVVPGATVVATNLDTKAQDAVSSDPAGDYNFRALPAGRYAIEFRKPGFMLQRKEIVLVANAAPQLDATLIVGNVSETVEVVATPTRPRTPAAAPRRIRVGGNVQATRMLKMVRPAYPPAARDNGVQGSVILRAVIGVDGGLLSTQLVSTLADPDLAKAALDAVGQWRYTPTLLNGEPVEVVTTITVNFVLAQ
jgi:TonB family protein